MDLIDYAKHIVSQLVDAGYTAYFAGGWVRDFLMGHPSEDIDIATSAPPEEVVKLFPKTVSVGMNFGVVVVVMEGYSFEISTFRRDIDYVDGRHPKAIAFSTPQEDAKRRDFTINGMFYDPLAKRLIDYVGGQEDLKKGIIRTIGDPRERFEEDRLRMIRAVRFSVRFGFPIEEKTSQAIKEYAHTLFPAVSMERVWQELKKMAEYPHFEQAVLKLHQLGLLGVIFPQLQSVKEKEMRQRVSSFAAFPKKCPPILYLMELFPEASCEQQIQLCQYLKVSNQNIKLVEQLGQLRSKESQRWEDVDWARYYARPNAQLCLEVVAARLTSKERAAFLARHKARQKRLAAHVARIASKKPLVTASDLKKEGIAPGKRMGELLQEAERVAVNANLQQKEQVLDALKKNIKWKQ